MRNRLLHILIAIDVLVFALLTLGGSKRNETISACAWVMEQDGRLLGRIFRPAIDFILGWLETNHCAESWLAEKDKYS